MAVSGTVDRLALAALVGVLPTAMVDTALQDSGRVAERVRTLPPWVTAYHVLASAMYPSASYGEVTDLLWSTLPAATGRRLARQVPSKGAVTRARARLGAEPLQLLLARLLGNQAPSTAVYLHKAESGPSAGLWWICDVDTGGLRGCDVRGDEIGAAAELVETAGAHHVAVCPPHGDRSWELLELLERLGRSATVTVVDLPPAFEAPWAGLRARTPAAWQQEALARACVQAALGAALAAASQPR
jgi:Insertion element 4 transposase N-terminal